MAEKTKEPGTGQEGAQAGPKQPPAQRARAEAGPSPPPRRGGLPPHIVWAIVSAIVLVVFAPGLFAAGFFTNELVDDEGGGGPSVVATAQPTATPPVVVAVSVDNAPSWGPEDAPVTIVEFSDFL